MLLIVFKFLFKVNKAKCHQLFINKNKLSAVYGYAEISAETLGVVTKETIQRAFQATEEGFASLVSELWSTMPNLATVGTCCLVGVIYQSTLFVASLGDSRVVLGKKGSSGGLSAIQLSSEHNANNEDIRWELKDLHPDDPQIVVFKHGVWRVKGIIQVMNKDLASDSFLC